MKDLSGKTVAVVGIARSGLGAIRLLKEHGANVRAIDERTNEQVGEFARQLQDLNVPLLPQAAPSFSGNDLVVLSPGVPFDLPELAQIRASGVPVVGEVELASWFLKGPIIGITGSNGKTTTTALTGHIMREAGVPCQTGGNIGTAVTSLVASSEPEKWNVLELSSFQLESIDTFRAQIGVCLNVTPDHLDRHGTFERYAEAKARLFENQTAADHAVLNADNATTLEFAARTKAQVHWFSRQHPVERGISVAGTDLVCDGEVVMPTKDIPLRGSHNVENAMAAMLAAKLAGVPASSLRAGVMSFPGVEHRLEFVRERNGVSYYNDSKATNVDATEKAVDAFPGGIWIILGGKDKDSDYSVLKGKLREKAAGILLIGSAAEKIADQLNGLAVQHSGTLERAVETAGSKAKSGETVLLAPACASFDQFENFEHRGRTFKHLVNGL